MSQNSSLKKLRFPGQRENEKVELVIRKHKISLLGSFLYLLAMLAIPWIVFYIVAPIALLFLLEAPYSRLFLLLTLIYYLFLWLFAFIVWIDYYYDLWLITDQRLLDIEQKGFFSRVVSELDLKRIQDITSEVHGILPTLFEFGSIHIQTAGEKNRFILESVPHPVTIRRKIVKLYERARKKNKFGFGEE
jgi:uncharacterized membrane protein YdbT with pleckstrin-like domain